MSDIYNTSNQFKQIRKTYYMSKPSYVYLLVSINNATYIGAIVDIDHRLRQHNKEIKGGAHAPRIKVSKGEVWH